MNTKAEYIPGTCNIGPAEIKGRKKAMAFTAIITIALIIILLVLHVDKLWRLTLFIPAAGFGVCFLQVYNKFCVNFGLRGIFNFGDMGKTYTVEQKENFQKDRAKAWKMITTGILLGAIVTILFYIL